MPNYMTVEQASIELDVHKNTILNMIGDGRLTATRFDEKETSPWMIDPDSVKAYKKAKSKTGPLKATAK